MKNENEVAGMLEILLSVPGMESNVKVPLQMPRNLVLLVTQVIRQGMQQKEGMVKQLLAVLPQSTVDDLKALIDELLQKSELTALDAKLQKFNSN